MNWAKCEKLWVMEIMTGGRNQNWDQMSCRKQWTQKKKPTGLNLKEALQSKAGLLINYKKRVRKSGWRVGRDLPYRKNWWERSAEPSMTFCRARRHAFCKYSHCSHPLRRGSPLSNNTHSTRDFYTTKTPPWTQASSIIIPLLRAETLGSSAAALST